jgi:hypothetical protein
MSSNLLNTSNNPNKDIQTQRNCVNPKSGKLHFRDFTKTHDDSCYITEQTKQSLGPGKYQVSNHNHCECSIPDVVDKATSTPLVYFQNGKGVGSCVVDQSTELRVGKSKNNPKCPIQLFERPYLTVPYMGRGSGDQNLETQLLPGEPTKEKRQCSTLSGITIENYFTPLVDHLRENVQNPIHIVEEFVQEGWIRGGSNTRLIVRDIDYLERCGYQYMNKSSNDTFWESKHKHF